MNIPIKLPLVLYLQFKPIVRNYRYQRSGEGNVFSRVCVSTGGGSHVTHVMHWTLPYTGPPPPMFRLVQYLDFTVQGHLPGTCSTWSSLYRDPSPSLHSTRTASSAPTLPNLDMFKLLRLASGWLTPYWNAFLI